MNGTAVMVQPAPDGGQGQPIQDMVTASLADHPNPVMRQVGADIETRAQVGQRRYGTRLYAHNGRLPLVDAYQEALDLVVYLRQALEEGRPVAVAYGRALQLAADVCAELDRVEVPGAV